MTVNPENSEIDDALRRALAGVERFTLIGDRAVEKLLRRLHAPLRMIPRSLSHRALALMAITWIPMAVFSVIAGWVTGRPVLASFLEDYPIHIRTLVTIPVLVMVEGVVDRQFRLAAGGVLDGGLILPRDTRAFADKLGHIERLRDDRATPMSVVLLACVASATLYLARARTGVPLWMGGVHGESLRGLSPAGWWHYAVALPVVLAVLVRWIWRWVLWCIFLWHVSRFDLQIVALHADRMGGLGFLSQPSQAYATVVFALSAAISGAWMRMALVEHVSARTFFAPFGAFVVIVMLFVFGPLVVFWRSLIRAKARDRERFGALIQRFVTRFDREWTHPQVPVRDSALYEIPAEPLANLGASFDVVDKMRTVPINRDAVMAVLIAAVIPMIPVALTEVPLSTLLRALFKSLV